MGETGPKSKFQNTSPGVAGAVVLDHKGEARGVPVAPKAEIWLSQEEQALTAHAPRHAKDNPFTDGTFTLIAKGEDLTESERPIGDDQQPTGEAEPPAPAPEENRDPEDIDMKVETPAPPPEQPPAPPAPEPEEKVEPGSETPPPPVITQDPEPAEVPVAVNPVEGEDGTVKAEESSSPQPGSPAPKPAPKAPPKRP